MPILNVKLWRQYLSSLSYVNSNAFNGHHSTGCLKRTDPPYQRPLTSRGKHYLYSSTSLTSFRVTVSKVYTRLIIFTPLLKAPVSIYPQVYLSISPIFPTVNHSISAWSYKKQEAAAVHVKNTCTWVCFRLRGNSPLQSKQHLRKITPSGRCASKKLMFVSLIWQ